MPSQHAKIKALLESYEPKATLSEDEQTAVRGLMDTPGFGLLLSYLASEQQGARVSLTYLNLEDPDQRRQATVLQGRIQGIERVRETMLELYPDVDPTETEQ